MANKLRYLRFLFFFGALGKLTSAQEQSAELHLRFTVFCPEQIQVGALSYILTSIPTIRASPITFYPTARSPVYEYQGFEPLRFIDSETEALVTTADVPSDVREPLLIFFPIHPAPATGDRYKVFVYDDSRTNQDARGLAILNFSGLPISGTVDRRQVQLSPGHNGPYQVGKTAVLEFQTEFRNRVYHTYGGVAKIGQDGRALLILLPPFYRGSLEVQSRLLLDDAVPTQRTKR